MLETIKLCLISAMNGRWYRVCWKLNCYQWLADLGGKKDRFPTVMFPHCLGVFWLTGFWIHFYALMVFSAPSLCIWSCVNCDLDRWSGHSAREQRTRSKRWSLQKPSQKCVSYGCEEMKNISENFILHYFFFFCKAVRWLLSSTLSKNTKNCAPVWNGWLW